MKAIRLKNGNLLIPIRAEGPGMIGDGAIEIAPGDPRYAEWEKWAVDEDDEGLDTDEGA